MYSRNLIPGAISLIVIFTVFTTVPAEARGLYGQAEIAQASIDEAVDADGFIFRLDDSSSAYRLALGYEFTDIVSIEAGYNDFGEVKAQLPGVTATAQADGLELGLVFRWPLSGQFSLAGRAGYLIWDATTVILPVRSPDDGSDVFVGIGAEYQASDRVALTLGWSRYRLDDIDVSYASLGLRFGFGARD